MMATTRSKTKTNLIGAPKASPKKLLADLNPTNPLASIVHQADKSGKQQPILTGGRRISSESSGTTGANGGSFRNLFANILSAMSSSRQLTRKLKVVRPLKSRRLRVLQVTRSSCAGAFCLDKKCLVLDLDETLVHSSFKPTSNPDFIIPVNIDGTTYHAYVCVRPGAEEFLVEMAKHYEIVIYTVSQSKYADPLLDKLDPEGVIRYRLYASTAYSEGSYVKDLSLLDRDISQTIIIDNAPMSYIFHPHNAIGCSSFYDDPSDRELESISRFLGKIHDVEDVREHLHIWDANY